MFHIRIQLLVLVLPFLPVSQTAALADYISQTVGLSSTAPNPISGSVQIEAYDGQGAAGGGLNAGQVRLTFHANAPIGNVGDFSGFEGVGFNTDLSLNPSQITGPMKWGASSNRYYSIARFPWVVRATALDSFTGSWLGMPDLVYDGRLPLHNDLSVLISGLGSNATHAHFQFPAEKGTPAVFYGEWWDLRDDAFGFHFSSQILVASESGSASGPLATPEPSTLFLCCLGLAGLLARRVLQRRQAPPPEFGPMLI
jgi:hypothetical protein